MSPAPQAVPLASCQLGSIPGAARAWTGALLHHRDHCAGCWPAMFKYFGRILFSTGRNAFNSLHFSWRPALGMWLPPTHAQVWLESVIWHGCALWLGDVSKTDLKSCWRNDRRSMQTCQDQRPDSDFSCRKAAAASLKAVVLLFSNACEGIVHYSFSEPKHIRAFMSLGYLVHGAVNLLRRHCQLLLAVRRRIHLIQNSYSSWWKMHCCSAACGAGKGRRLPYTSSQIFGVVEKIPGCLQSCLHVQSLRCLKIL